MSIPAKLRVTLKKIPIISPLGSYVLKLKRVIKGKYLKFRHPSGAYLSCNGIEVYCDFSNESYWWYDGDAANLSFDNAVIKGILESVVGEVYLDIGAHFGYFSALLTKELSLLEHSSTLIAVEPDKSNYGCLVKTVEKHKSNNIKTITLPCAISDVDGMQKMYTSDQPCLHSYAEPGARVTSEVSAISLNSIISNYVPNDKVAFIKIDIDGAEPLFFKGGWEVLNEHKPIIFIEFAPKYLESFGADVKEYYYTLCDKFYVYWVSYQDTNIRAVTKSDYQEIVDTVGYFVTDFVLSYAPLKNDKLFNNSINNI